MIHAYDTTHKIQYLDDLFDKTVSDAEWIKSASGHSPKPVIITADNRIRRNPIERRVLASSGLTIFFFQIGFPQSFIPHAGN
jgi:hypothetical protein